MIVRFETWRISAYHYTWCYTRTAPVAQQACVWQRLASGQVPGYHNHTVVFPHLRSPFRKVDSMRLYRSVSMAATALLLAVSLSLAAAQEKAIAVELKSFTFKAKEGQDNLFGYNDGEGKLFFYTNGPGTGTVKVPDDGDYEIVVKASCDPALNERAKFKLTIDAEVIGKETLLTADEVRDYKFSAKLKKGDRKLTIEFTNDAYKEGEYDRNLYVYEVTLKKTK
jgi:hypothetical protein